MSDAQLIPFLRLADVPVLTGAFEIDFAEIEAAIDGTHNQREDVGLKRARNAEILDLEATLAARLPDLAGCDQLAVWRIGNRIRDRLSQMAEESATPINFSAAIDMLGHEVLAAKSKRRVDEAFEGARQAVTDELRPLHAELARSIGDVPAALLCGEPDAAHRAVLVLGALTGEHRASYSAALRECEGLLRGFALRQHESDGGVRRATAMASARAMDPVVLDHIVEARVAEILAHERAMHVAAVTETVRAELAAALAPPTQLESDSSPPEPTTTTDTNAPRPTRSRKAPVAGAESDDSNV